MRLYAPKSDALTGKRKPSLVMKDAQPTLLAHSISLRPDAVLMPRRANLPVINRIGLKHVPVIIWRHRCKGIAVASWELPRDYSSI